MSSAYTGFLHLHNSCHDQRAQRHSRSGTLRTLEARDFNSGTLLWEFQTETPKRHANWVLTSEKRYVSPWREKDIVAADQQFGCGAIFSTPSWSTEPSTSAVPMGVCTPSSETDGDAVLV